MRFVGLFPGDLPFAHICFAAAALNSVIEWCKSNGYSVSGPQKGTECYHFAGRRAATALAVQPAR